MARGQHKAFTLIELMIAIAILAIVGAVAVSSVMQLGGLTREQFYNRSLSNAQYHLSQIESADFDQLPPQELKATSGGQVKLAHGDLVEGSIEILTLSGIKLDLKSVNLKTGLIELGDLGRGQTLVAHYSYYAPDISESHFADSNREVTLDNSPVTRVAAVHLAKGDSLKPVSDFELTASGKLRVPSAQPGQLVVVDYLGGQWGNQVSGTFLDEELKPTSKASKIKFVEVGEKYPGAWRAALGLVRAK